MSDRAAEFEVVAVDHVATSSFLRLEELKLVAADGSEVLRTVVRHPGAVAVVPVDGDDVVLIRQYRAPIGKSIVEIPAGKLDVAGEDLVDAARRELEEEVGLQAADLELVASMWTAPGFTDEKMWIYVARNLTAVAARPHGVEEQHADVVRLPVADLPDLLKANHFEDAKTIVGLSALVGFSRQP